MRGWVVVAALAAMAPLAGCLASDEGVDLGGLGAGPGTLDAAPAWQPGDWWHIELTDDFTRQTRTLMQVVAAANDTHYLVGFPAEAWDDDALLLHIPGYGEIARGSLGYDVHDQLFEPVRFPLTDGATWDTTFEGQPATALVAEVTATTARVSVVGVVNFNLTYDAEQGMLTKLDAPGYGAWELVERGSGYRGEVLVPEGIDIVMLHGRIAGALGLNPLARPPGPPLETVEIRDGYDAMTFAILLGTVLPDTDSPQGVYSERVTAPDGTVYEDTVTPADRPGLHIFTYHYGEPTGTWTLQHTAAGPGVAATEAVAYRVGSYELE